MPAAASAKEADVSFPDTHQLSDHVGPDPAIMSDGILLINPEVVRAERILLPQILIFFMSDILNSSFFTLQTYAEG